MRLLSDISLDNKEFKNFNEVELDNFLLMRNANSKTIMSCSACVFIKEISNDNLNSSKEIRNVQISH